MPIMHDIMDHEIIVLSIGQGLQQGMQEGLQQGMQRGLQEGLQQGLQQGKQQEGISILRRLIEKRFGPLSPVIEERLAGLSIAELEDLSLRVLDAQSVNDLFNL